MILILIFAEALALYGLIGEPSQQTRTCVSAGRRHSVMGSQPSASQLDVTSQKGPQIREHADHAEHHCCVTDARVFGAVGIILASKAGSAEPAG